MWDPFSKCGTMSAIIDPKWLPSVATMLLKETHGSLLTTIYSNRSLCFKQVPGWVLGPLNQDSLSCDWEHFHGRAWVSLSSVPAGPTGLVCGMEPSAVRSSYSFIESASLVPSPFPALHRSAEGLWRTLPDPFMRLPGKAHHIVPISTVRIGVMGSASKAGNSEWQV